MAQFITYAKFRDKVLVDVDLEQEQFITDKELIGYTNTAIDDAEAIIHGLYEDYFLKSDTFGLTAGIADYALPADIYGDKIRRVLFDDSGVSGQGRFRRYRVTQLKQFDRTLDIDDEDRFRYILINDGPADVKMRWFPTPVGTTAPGAVIRYYIRAANRIDEDADQATIDATILDIPEFQSYLYAHVKWQIAGKERLGQDVQVSFQRLQFQHRLMEDTLTSRTPDEDNMVAKDLSSYYDFYYNDENYFNI